MLRRLSSETTDVGHERDARPCAYESDFNSVTAAFDGTVLTTPLDAFVVDEASLAFGIESFSATPADINLDDLVCDIER